MRLSYTITPDDRRQSRRIDESALAPMRWLTGIAEPFSFAALGFGIYCYATGNRALAFSLFASFGYLFSEGFLLRLIRDFLSDRRRSESEHFQLETGNAGITFSVIGVSPNDGPTPSQKSWSEFRAYCETPDLFVLSSGRTCYAIPKRSLTTPEISEFQAILSGELSQRTVRTRIRGVRHAVSLVLLGYIAFFFFGGTIERALWWVFRPFRPRQTFSEFRSSASSTCVARSVARVGSDLSGSDREYGAAAHSFFAPVLPEQVRSFAARASQHTGAGMGTRSGSPTACG